MKLKNPNDTLTTGGFLAVLLSITLLLFSSLIVAEKTGWLQYIPHF